MSDLSLLAAVAVAGGIGSALRYLADNAVSARAGVRYPWGTTVVNVTGSFALGSLVGLVEMDEYWHTVLGMGLIGGYTTFSTASLETVGLLAARRPLAGAAHGLGLLVVCVAAAMAGITLTQP